MASDGHEYVASFLIVIHKPRRQLLPHLLEPSSSTSHFSAPVVKLLYLLDGEPELFRDISNTLVDHMDIGDGNKSLSINLRLTVFSALLVFLHQILRWFAESILN